ncbi:hypothetical protein ANN_03412 [Periplaneta americana]|uniref:Reverse transcriptase n=1 Tax=Periplaneta americana TaxID=6978 RepID=A0ABQ8TYW1_PERAM|nr:hypothetical protein ANN_03412 [Periplaneta americana]
MLSIEWRDALKMAGNVAAVRAIPGRTIDKCCRHCGSEIETLQHVLGSCPHGEALRNARHHKFGHRWYTGSIYRANWCGVIIARHKSNKLTHQIVLICLKTLSEMLESQSGKPFTTGNAPKRRYLLHTHHIVLRDDAGCHVAAQVVNLLKRLNREILKHPSPDMDTCAYDMFLKMKRPRSTF